MPIVVSKRRLQRRIYDLELANGMTPSAPRPESSRLSQVFTRQRPVVLEKDVLLDKALQVAMKPMALGELAPAERDQVDQLAKALQVGSGWTKSRRPAAQRPVPKPQSAALVAARAHQILGPQSSVTPVDIAVAMQRQGLDFIEPFAPGQPLTPFYGYNRRPRTYNYQVGRNTTTETRENRMPYATLDRLWKSYDVAQIATRYSINDLRSMRVRFEAKDGWEENPVKEITEAKRVLRRPDGFYTLRLWLAMNQRNLWIFDSAPIHRLRDRAGRLKHLMNFTPTTLAPMLDYYGWFPEGTAPAYQQFIEGVPWDWMRREDVIYWPFWPETSSLYGTPPLESVLINANTDVRLQLYFLQFFTTGTVPEAFAMAPEDMTSADDLATLQEEYDSEQFGDQAKRWGLKWLPHGTELEFYKPTSFDPDLAEYVMRRTVAAFGLTPQNLGILDDVNKATATSQMDQQFRVSTLPIVGYYEDLLDSVLQDDLTLPVQVRFDTGREKEDRLMEAQAHQIYVQIGAESADEVREKVLGYPVNPEERVPRFFESQRLGPVPLEWMMSVAGDVDPLTGAPRPGTVERREYVMIGQQEPDPPATPPSSQYGDAAQRDARQGRVVHPKDPGVPVTASREKVYPEVGQPSVAKSEPETDERLGPLGWGEGSPSASPDGEPGYGTRSPAATTYGSTAQGLGMRSEGDTEPPHLLSQAETQDMRRWQRQSRDRVAKGKPPRLFCDSAITTQRTDAVWGRLEKATTRKAVDEAFAKAKGPLAGGLVVQAADTGRVLLIQRTPDKHDAAEAYARWEFPGGKLTGDSPWTGARREWEEETGAELRAFTHLGNWISPDGVYVGYAVEVPSETSVRLDPQPEEVSEARWWAKEDLSDPAVRDKVTETLDRVRPLLKGWAAQPRNPRGHWSTPAAARRQRMHRNTDRIIEHYTPLIQRVMARHLPRHGVHDLVRRTYADAGVVAKATTRPTRTRALALAMTPVAAGMIGAGVAGGAVGAAGAAAAAGPGAKVGAGLSALADTTVAVALGTLLALLYADAYLQGAYGAAQEVGGSLPPWMGAVPIPEHYWRRWVPGRATPVRQVAGTSLARLVAESLGRAKGIDHTQIERIAQVVAEGVKEGESVLTVLLAVDLIIDTPKRAEMVAEAEYMRAMSAAQMDVYRRAGVTELEWLIEPGACERCVANHEASPQPTTNPQWPFGPIPVHPYTRCTVVPYRGG